MGLHELPIGKEARILEVTAIEPFKSRLLSLGFSDGEIVKILAYTLAKNSYEVEINNALIALRSEEARMVIIEHD